MVRIICYLLLFFNSIAIAAGGSDVELQSVQLDLTDYASLQRGSKTFMNYCVGCHSLKYMRYDGLAKGTKIIDEEGNILKDVLKSSLMFNAIKISENIESSMRKEDGEVWFGVSPPDLSLVTRSRGSDWIYTFLKSYYKDDSRPWGVNNVIFEATAMPHVFVNLQGLQELDKDSGILLPKKDREGSLSAEEYDKMVTDLVNFLTFVGEPNKVEREYLGVFVLLFLGILIIFTYLLKREYWKEVH